MLLLKKTSKKQWLKKKLTQGRGAQIGHFIFLPESVGQDLIQKTAEMGCLWHTVFMASLERLKGWGWCASGSRSPVKNHPLACVSPALGHLFGRQEQWLGASPCDLGSSPRGGCGRWNVYVAAQVFICNYLFKWTREKRSYLCDPVF